MPTGVTTINDLLKAVLKGTDPSWRANANVYIALHTDDPRTLPQTAYEAAYTGYARVAVSKSSGWVDSGVTFSNAAVVSFGACTAGPGTYWYFSIGTEATGAGQILYSGALTATMVVDVGVTPQCIAGAISVTGS
jgi:hypothetical protein